MMIVDVMCGCMDLQFIERFYTLLTLKLLGVSNPLFGAPVPSLPDELFVLVLWPTNLTGSLSLMNSLVNSLSFKSLMSSFL